MVPYGISMKEVAHPHESNFPISVRRIGGLEDLR
jgi:hypothetical protein